MSRILCWDSTIFIHADRADRLDSLATYLPDVRHIVCDVVIDELGGMELPAWLEPVTLDDLATLHAFARWQQVVGSRGRKHLGEAAVLAWSQVHGAISMIDDADARLVARRAGADVHGSLWALVEGIKNGRSNPQTTSNLCDCLVRTKIRWPFGFGGFTTWAIEAGLLDE